MLDSYNFAAVTKEVAAAFLFAKLTDKVTDPMKSRKFAANNNLKVLYMIEFKVVMAILLPVLQSLMYAAGTVYYVVKTVKELS